MKAAPEIGQPNDVGWEFFDDQSVAVCVEYVLTEEQWAALEAQWEAKAGGDCAT